MTPSDNKRDFHWSIQVSIAKAAARISNPSLMELHHDILEEFGSRPSPDLVNYFIDIAKISDENVEEYLRYVGATTKKQKPGKTEKDPYYRVADSIALGDNPTVLKFRQAFIKEHEEPPSEKLISYFLKKIQSAPQRIKSNGDKDDMFHFAEVIATGSRPTVLKFRQEFSKRYGANPSAKLTEYFLGKMQKCDRLQLKDEDYEGQVHFVKTVAKGVIPTILQFRKAFEKVYGEAPSAELIEIFIENMSS